MLKHPYFEYQEVKKVFNLRDNCKINNLDTLKNIGIVSVTKLEKIKHYFTILY